MDRSQAFRCSFLGAFALLTLACSDAGSPGGDPQAGGASGGAPGAGTGGAAGAGGSGGPSGSGAGGTAGSGASGSGHEAGTSGVGSGGTPSGASAGAPSGFGGLPSGGAGGEPSGSGSGGAGSGGSEAGGAGAGGLPQGGSGSGGAGNGGASGGSGGATAGTGAGSGGAGAGSAGTSGGSGGAGTGGSGGSASPGQPVGFASLNGGTTGGKGGQVVSAATYAELKSYAESSTAYVIQIMGTISNGADGGKISVKSNKTLLGVGNDAFLNGVGLDINGANNIIVQNLRISLLGVTTRSEKSGVYTSSGDGGLPQILVNGGDAISISGTSKNVWIDHCELFSEDPTVQTNKDLYDGLIDVKNQAGFITISWNYFHDHHKGGLVGSSDTDLFADRKLTFHHNHYDNVKLRIPMYRGSTGHFFNNYVARATDASEIRADTCVRIEKNYYEALHYSIYTPSDAPGRAQRIDNIEVMRTSRAYPSDCTADIPYSYSNVLLPAADVKTAVPAGAGVGKL